MSTNEFARLTKLRLEAEATLRNARAEMARVDEALLALAGIKVGDVIAKYQREPDGAQIQVNSVAPGVYFADELDKVHLSVAGTSSPITKGGTPHRSIRWERWSRILDISMPMSEYRALVKGEG